MEKNRAINNDLVSFSKKSTNEMTEEYHLHCHSFYEIYYFIDGKVDYMVEGKHYAPKPGSLMLFRPGLVHGVLIHGDARYTRYTFHFMPEMVPKEHQEILFSPFYEDKVYYENVNFQACFDAVLEAWSLPKKIREIAVLSRFETLLTELYAIKTHESEEEDADLAGSIVAYINAHITEDISLEELAKSFFISKSQLNRVFKRSMNTTVGNYISLKRANLARLLLRRGKTAEIAASESGFKDYSTFYRTYKRVMGHAPTQTLNYTILDE